MTLIVLRPDGTVFTDMTVTGAGSADAALSDDLDVSHVSGGLGTSVSVDFEDITIPAGAVVKEIRGRLRQSHGVAASNIWRMFATIPSRGSLTQFFPSTIGVQTFTSNPVTEDSD